MLARRLTLLMVFAGGCLSGAMLIVLWQSDAASPPAGERAATPSSLGVEEPIAEAHTGTSTEQVTGTTDATQAVPSRAPASAGPSLHEAARTAPTPEAGSSVADVLARLEAAYRQKVAVAAPVAPPEPPVAEPPPAAAPVSASAALVATAAPVAPPAPVAQAGALPAGTPRAEARPSVADDTANAPVAVSQNGARPSITIGDVHTTTVNNVHQGDVILMQQLALLQNIQLLALAPYGRSHGVAVPTHTPRGTTRRSPPFATSLTNPDNPWGFDFPPTVLAK